MLRPKYSIGRDFWGYSKAHAKCDWWVQCMLVCIWSDWLWKDLHHSRNRRAAWYCSSSTLRAVHPQEEQRAVVHSSLWMLHGRTISRSASWFARPWLRWAKPSQTQTWPEGRPRDWHDEHYECPNTACQLPLGSKQDIRVWHPTAQDRPHLNERRILTLPLYIRNNCNNNES